MCDRSGVLRSGGKRVQGPTGGCGAIRAGWERKCSHQTAKGAMPGEDRVERQSVSETGSTLVPESTRQVIKGSSCFDI